MQPFLLALMQVIRPGLGYDSQTVFIRRCQRIQPFAKLAPFGRPLCPLPLQQTGHLPGPAQVILRQHR